MLRSRAHSSIRYPLCTLPTALRMQGRPMKLTVTACNVNVISSPLSLQFLALNEIGMIQDGNPSSFFLNIRLLHFPAIWKAGQTGAYVSSYWIFYPIILFSPLNLFMCIPLTTNDPKNTVYGSYVLCTGSGPMDKLPQELDIRLSSFPEEKSLPGDFNIHLETSQSAGFLLFYPTL